MTENRTLYHGILPTRAVNDHSPILVGEPWENPHIASAGGGFLIAPHAAAGIVDLTDSVTRRALQFLSMGRKLSNCRDARIMHSACQISRNIDKREASAILRTEQPRDKNRHCKSNNTDNLRHNGIPDRGQPGSGGADGAGPGCFLPALRPVPSNYDPRQEKRQSGLDLPPGPFRRSITYLKPEGKGESSCVAGPVPVVVRRRGGQTSPETQTHRKGGKSASIAIVLPPLETGEGGRETAWEGGAPAPRTCKLKGKNELH